MELLNKDLRRKIAQMIAASGEGHIPSSYSIVDIIDHLYGHVLKFDAKNPSWNERDHFILSKGHGAAGLFVVLHKYGFFSEHDLSYYSTERGILGGHPDRTKAPGAEASTGSLGHGFPFALGTALGLRIQGQNNRVFVLLGDGECNEGTIWESAMVAANYKLGNLTAIIDLNGSAEQILSLGDVRAKWDAFGWKTFLINGHSKQDFDSVFSELTHTLVGTPKVIIAKTIKGKGVSFVEGHGPWHHKIPNEKELEMILRELL